MRTMKKGQNVKLFISVLGGVESSTDTIKEVTKKYVKLEGTKGMKFDPETGEELDPAVPGAFAYFKVVKQTRTSVRNKQ